MPREPHWLRAGARKAEKQNADGSRSAAPQLGERDSFSRGRRLTRSIVPRHLWPTSWPVAQRYKAGKEQIHSAMLYGKPEENGQSKGEKKPPKITFGTTSASKTRKGSWTEQKVIAGGGGEAGEKRRRKTEDVSKHRPSTGCGSRGAPVCMRSKSYTVKSSLQSIREEVHLFIDAQEVGNGLQPEEQSR